nr:hypothetical protein [uncultured Bacteroides sp.]
MKQIVGNRYLKSYKFSSLQETSVFINNQKTSNFLSIDDTFGDNYFCYVCCHSLTRKKEFVLSFCSDEKEENLSFLFWNEYKLFVLDTGKNIYLINDTLNIVASFDISIYLIGLYLTNKNNLLILEEASFKLINPKGQILMNESLDLIENFSIENGKLSIQTSEENKTFELA